MKLFNTFIDRPVFSMVLSLVIILFGLLSYTNLDTRYLPNIPHYSLYIQTSYPGASAKLIEQNVNTPIEEAVSTVSGIDTLKSTAEQGESRVIISFEPDVNFSEKSSEVREKLSSIRGKLPTDIDPPVISNWSSDDFLLDIVLVNPNMKSIQLRDYFERYIKDKIEQIPGVGNASVYGSSRYAMRVWLDPEKMAARKITVQDVQQVLEKNNIQMTGGEFKSETMDFPINENTVLQTAKQFNDLVLRTDNGNFVRLKDVGHAKLGQDSDSFMVRYNGQPAVGMDVFLESGANPMAVSKAVHRELDLLKQQFPAGMKADIVFDISGFYGRSVFEVYLSVLLSILCVIAVIYLFLGSFRAMFIPVITIPICILGAFCFISLFGFSINMLTLLAIVLSIGLVVDDSIVMLENIHRHIEHRLTPYFAAKKGLSEIVFPVIAMTLTLVGVYLPIGFLHTRAALMSREFAFTLAGAVFISGFVALTLTPMMCSKLLTHQSENRYTHFLDRFFFHLKKTYSTMLKKCIAYRWIILLLCLGILSAGIFLYFHLPKMNLPSEDSGMIQGGITLPTGSNTAYTFNATQQLKTICSKMPGVESILNIASDNDGRLVLMLKPYEKRSLTADQIASELTDKATENIPGFNGYFSAMGSDSGSGADLKFYIMTSGDYAELYQTMQKIMPYLKQYSVLKQVDSDMKLDSQQYDVVLNREAAESMGINAEDIDETISTLIGGRHITDFMMGGQSYDVVVQAKNKARSDPSITNQMYLKNALDQMIPLKTLVSFQPILEQQKLNHYSRLRAAMISAQIAPGYQLSDAVNYLQLNLPNWLPSDTKYAFEGKAKHLLETGSSMNLIFVLGLLFIYLILSAQFESFIDPLIILFTVPLSVIGGLLFLKLFGGSLNIYTDIGLVTLIGLVSKHGVLITQFANKIRETENVSINEAVIKAATTRLRPILMTTGAMIFGALPLLFATGFGSNGRSQLGQVIVGGLLFGTFFSLVLTPVAYTYLARFKKIKKDE